MPAPPYDTLDVIVQAVRSRLLDAIQSTAGDVFTDTAPGTLLAINAGWRRMQEVLSKLGFQKFTGQTVLSGLAAVQPANPVNLCRLDWAGYNYVAGNNAGIVLPDDFICPIGIDERVTNSGTDFFEMDDMSEAGLPLATKGTWMKMWEWRGDAIYFPGSTATIDIRLRYWAYADDFVAAGTTPFNQQPVPIMRCLDCFAGFICAEAARARGDLDGKQFTADAEAAALILVGRENPAVAVAPPPAPATPTAGGQ